MGKRHSPEQIVRKLRQAEPRLAAGASIPEAARELGISEATFHRWRNQYGPIRWDELTGGQAPQGAGERECPPEEVGRRTSTGHRHPKGGESGKLLSPTRRRAAVEHVGQQLGVSERRACRVIGQPRSSQRYAGRKAERDRRLAERMVRLSRENPRYGYRRVWAMLRREGWPVNKKRVHRLWREEGLKVPEKQHKRQRLPILGESENGCTRRRAEHKDHVSGARTS
jgi:transposase